VRKAAEDCAAAEKPTPLRIHAEGGKCWTFAQISAAGLKAGREEFLEGKVCALCHTRAVVRGGGSWRARSQPAADERNVLVARRCSSLISRVR
jgi:mono/diheme cytochrome c family protein